MQGNRFKQSNRLLKAVDFKLVFRQASRASDEFFTVLAGKNQKKTARLGLAISKKSTRLAVDRNKLKRLARESFRYYSEQMKGLDFVVLAKPGASGQTNKRLSKSLADLWKMLIKKVQ